MHSALVILSGGQDSTTCLYWAKERFDRVHGISFFYGQRHRIELDSAKAVANHAQLDSWELVNISGLLRAASTLTDESKPIAGGFDQGAAPTTFVPLRNAMFLMVAANYAISKGFKNLVTGVSQSDGAGYPDCRREFIESQEQTINLALGTEGFKIHTPLMDMSKAQSVRLAASMSGCMDALALSHTCYAGQRPPCGKCNACVLREQGFNEAGIPDPLTTA